jgi:hypothetical protein
MTHDLIPKEHWSEFFNTLTKDFRDHRIDLEVAGLDVGDQLEEEYVPLDGFSYEPRSDTLVVHSPNHDHEILRPAEVGVAHEGAAIGGVSIMDTEGRVHLVRFKTSPALPTP